MADQMKRLTIREALELVRDCSSQEWQQADGTRMAATDNQGRRFWFITEDVMQAVREATRKHATGPRGRRDRQELIGRRFGKLVVTEDIGNIRSKRAVRVVCDCGNTRDLTANALLTGNTASCGCNRPGAKSHGFAAKGSPHYDTYRAWSNMRSRVAGHISPKNYADRGITACDRWLSFENFLADMGERPSMKYSLDRYPDNDGPYSPENCRWATLSEQARNRRNVRLYEIGAERLCAKDWAAKYGVSVTRLRARLRAGKSIEQALGELQ